MAKSAPRPGSGSKQTVHLRPGLDLHIAGFKPGETMQMDFEIRDTFLRFSFYLEGDGYMAWPLLKGYCAPKKIRPIERCSSVSFCPESEGSICFPARQRQYHLTVQISPALLNAFMGGRFRRIPYDLEAISEGCNTIDFFHNGPLTPEMETAVRQIIDCPYSGSLGQIYQESRAIELVAHKLAQIESCAADMPASNKLRLNEVERVHHAKEILVRDLENPPRLFELARAVGTTHTQLNRGFRSVFGTSVFGYLRQLRLERARLFLEQGSMNVTEAAVAVGYNSLSSFSRAFSSHFGLKPASYLKKDRLLELGGSGSAPGAPALAFERKRI